MVLTLDAGSAKDRAEADGEGAGDGASPPERTPAASGARRETQPER
jgi:hypothetical protein